MLARSLARGVEHVTEPSEGGGTALQPIPQHPQDSKETLSKTKVHAERGNACWQHTLLLGRRGGQSGATEMEEWWMFLQCCGCVRGVRNEGVNVYVIS